MRAILLANDLAEIGFCTMPTAEQLARGLRNSTKGAVAGLEEIFGRSLVGRGDDIEAAFLHVSRCIDAVVTADIESPVSILICRLELNTPIALEHFLCKVCKCQSRYTTMETVREVPVGLEEWWKFADTFVAPSFPFDN